MKNEVSATRNRRVALDLSRIFSGSENHAEKKSWGGDQRSETRGQKRVTRKGRPASPGRIPFSMRADGSYRRPG
jgi:hypothetical protein